MHRAPRGCLEALARAFALLALAAAACGASTGLPTDWRVGKATFYGGEPDRCARRASEAGQEPQPKLLKTS